MRSFRWHPALAVALVAAGVVTACETVPYTGRSQLQFMSPQQDSEMGAQAYRQTLAKTKLSSDATASEMVTHCPGRGFPPRCRGYGRCSSPMEPGPGVGKASRIPLHPPLGAHPDPANRGLDAGGHAVVPAPLRSRSFKMR